jgi:crotonobetainyl-CoA:carnitine CoA-transferase CaiB-like acyl-CoA transferase
VARGINELNGGLVCYNIYGTRDGGYMTLAALEPQFWATFCQATGREDLLGQQLAPALPGEPAFEELCALFRTRSRQEWVQLLEGVDSCCEPLFSLEEALSSSPVQALNMLASAGLLPPIRLSGRPVEVTAVAPALGQHTAALLAELGYRDADLASLREQGII